MKLFLVNVLVVTSSRTSGVSVDNSCKLQFSDSSQQIKDEMLEKHKKDGDNQTITVETSEITVSDLAEYQKRLQAQ